METADHHEHPRRTCGVVVGTTVHRVGSPYRFPLGTKASHEWCHRHAPMPSHALSSHCKALFHVPTRLWWCLRSRKGPNRLHQILGVFPTPSSRMPFPDPLRWSSYNRCPRGAAHAPPPTPGARRASKWRGWNGTGVERPRPMLLPRWPCR
ncbi:hypothetical protein V8G54_006705 [Vigna mungo]|uniref:Uncharacterized protein n=1 Tax=Vigna mungo TaxID=3915 RepID=A0AAQ3S7L7_VIGMU